MCLTREKVRPILKQSVSALLEQQDHRGRGTSTPTQTAWVLEFLCEMGLQDTDGASKAVHYLVETRSESESWCDDSVVGTGHPGILYVEYPVYPKVFPVMALSAYLNPR
jgi:squalene-hopene/tetraprenyl-beta-curcumene cyclase